MSSKYATIKNSNINNAPLPATFKVIFELVAFLTSWKIKMPILSAHTPRKKPRHIISPKWLERLIDLC